MRTDDFFDYARERQMIKIRRQSSDLDPEHPQGPPWTDDPILQQYRFCNIYREDDRTTQWFRENVRERVATHDVLLATVIFRWFNKIETGEAIFSQVGDYTEDGQGTVRTAFEQYLIDGNLESLQTAVLRHRGRGPYVTGSYIIKTPNGMDKLKGVLWCIDQFSTQHRKMELTGGTLSLNWRTATQTALDLPQMEGTMPLSLENMWSWLREFPYLGDFMAYEIVTDLRHTPLLDLAPDIETWANPGPGAMRGLNRLQGRDLNKKLPKHAYICEMRELLSIAQDRSVWPERLGPAWEMREVEHTLCEFDKYERARLGEGRPRQIFRGGR